MGPLTERLIKTWPTPTLNTLLYLHGEHSTDAAVRLYLRFFREKRSILRLTARDFLNLEVEALRTGEHATRSDFREIFMLPDVLFLEDFGFFANKIGIQEDLYILLDKRTEKGLLTVVSDINPPRVYTGTIENRVISVVEGYMLLDSEE